MKKFIVLSVAAVCCLGAHAISLFPHFVDVAGDYKDGTPEKFRNLNISTGYWRESPFFFSNIKSAEEFLADTLPFSSYVITREEKILDDKTQIVVYMTSLEADGLNEGKFSRLYLVQTPGEPLYVGISEDQI
ncbi:MAG: hypothetical protein K2N05_08125 [Muribaculaceae bacterium]|nr:hypothetical protein [Muribaculaceae bacterium]